MVAERRTEHAASADPIARRKQLKARNWALLLALVAFAVLIYIVSIVRMSGG